MSYFRSRTTKASHYDEYIIQQQRIKTLIPKRMHMLMFMIDGVKDYPPWSAWCGETRGGTGAASINCLGGFGLDSVVKKMIRNGEVVLSRYKSHGNAHGGNPTINRTKVTVTAHGRAVYAAWKKRIGKRIDLHD